MEMREAFQHDLPGHRAGQRGVLPGSQQRDGEERRRQRRAQQRRQQLVGALDVADLVMAGAVEGGGGQDQDGGVDEQRERQGDGGIGIGQPDRVCAILSASAR